MTDEKPEPARKLRVTLGHQVKMKIIEWWEDCWIALGALTLLAGREGLGKSTIACYWAAVETLRGNYVIYLHSEDSREHTVVPRLQAAGADLSKVIFLDVETEYTSEGNVILPYDNDELDALIAEYGVTFIVLDAATSAMSANLSGKDDRDVRRFLEPLSQLAAKHNIVILGLVHFGKRDGADSGKLILGSIAWSQVARSVLSVALDPDSGNLVVTNTKGNLAPKTRSAEARIRSTAITIDGRSTEIGVLEWLGETTADARDLLSGEPADSDSRTEAERWIEDYLTEHSEAASADVKRDAIKDLGCSKATVDRAAKALKVRSESKGFPRKTYWSLPTVVDGEVIDSHVSDITDEPHARERDATEATGPEQEKQDDATGEIPQLHQASVSDATGDATEDVDPETGIPNAVLDVLLDRVVPVRPTSCSVCNVELPKSATTDICEDCGDPSRQRPEPAVDRQLHVVHDGTANRGKVHICPHCGDALIYKDDITDGFHTSKGACVRAHRKGA